MSLPEPQPVVPISDGVGVVVAHGASVTRFKVGDRATAMFLPRWQTGPLTAGIYVSPVGGPTNRGMLADYVVVGEDEAAIPPHTLDDAEAVTLPVAGVTAWHAIVERAKVSVGETVLVHGTGGVALFAVQFAHALGARVAVTSSSDAKLNRARALGADFTVNYRTKDVVQSVLDWTDGQGTEHVVETVGGENLNTSLEVVRIGGTISFIGLIAGMAAQVNTYEFVTKNVTIHGIETGSREMYERMAAFIDQHHIRPVIDSTREPQQLPSLLHQLQRGSHFEKLVLA